MNKKSSKKLMTLWMQALSLQDRYDPTHVDMVLNLVAMELAFISNSGIQSNAS